MLEAWLEGRDGQGHKSYKFDEVSMHGRRKAVFLCPHSAPSTK
jgi:hypothetical protein